MKYLYYFFLFLVTACNPLHELKEGSWTGHLTPMNHPEMSIPVDYEVAYQQGDLFISIIGTDGFPVLTQHPRLENDTLYFKFNEPEEQVLLNCVLIRNRENEFSGKCMDPSEKWAQFTMVPPKPK